VGGHGYRRQRRQPLFIAGILRFPLLQPQAPAVVAAITVPTITLEGANNGAPHPAPASYRAKFTGKYEHHHRLHKRRRILLRRVMAYRPRQIPVLIFTGKFGEKGEAKYAGYEQRLAALPPITVPTITLEGANNGAGYGLPPPADPGAHIYR
jgi:hypothetical protein